MILATTKDVILVSITRAATTGLVRPAVAALDLKHRLIMYVLMCNNVHCSSIV